MESGGPPNQSRRHYVLSEHPLPASPGILLTTRVFRKPKHRFQRTVLCFLSTISFDIRRTQKYNTARCTNGQHTIMEDRHGWVPGLYHERGDDHPFETGTAQNPVSPSAAIGDRADHSHAGRDDVN